LADNVASHTPQLAPAVTTAGAGWDVHVLQVTDGTLFGALRIEAPRRFRYVAVTLEVVYGGIGCAQLFPDTVALVYTGSSPLHGLSQAPWLYFNEDTGEVQQLSESPVVVPVKADAPQHATFVYEFHQDCREFRLYFPGCEGIAIELEERYSEKG
jgi:hypothetical protein